MGYVSSQEGNMTGRENTYPIFNRRYIFIHCWKFPACHLLFSGGIIDMPQTMLKAVKRYKTIFTFESKTVWAIYNPSKSFFRECGLKLHLREFVSYQLPQKDLIVPGQLLSSIGSWYIIQPGQIAIFHQPRFP